MVKEGGSQVLNLNWIDSKKKHALIIYLREGWTGGKIKFSQLEVSISTRTGTLVGGLARDLAHSATKENGNCLVIACFVDHFT